jgi:hypothetical protein
MAGSGGDVVSSLNNSVIRENADHNSMEYEDHNEMELFLETFEGQRARLTFTCFLVCTCIFILSMVLTRVTN